MDHVTTAMSGVSKAPDMFMRKWQDTGLRFLRAQERMMEGFRGAAKIEMRFGQDFLSSRLELLKWDETAMPAHAERAMRDFDRAVCMMRDVSAELRASFSDAAKLLTIETVADIEATAEAIRETLHEQAEAAAETAEHAAAKASEVADEAVKAAAETTRRGAAKAKAAAAGGASEAQPEGDTA